MIEPLVLEQLRVGATAIIHEKLLEDAAFVARTADVSIAENWLGGTLAATMRACVLAERQQDQEFTAELSVPASWWQHLKQTHAPRWFTRRRPVKLTKLTRTVKFGQWHTYPNASIALPEDKFGQRVIVHQMIGDSGWL